MSLSLVETVNLLSALLAKKGAEAAAVSGSLLAAAGILLGVHGLTSLNHSHEVHSQVQSSHQNLQEKQVRFTQMEQRLRQELAKIQTQSLPVCVSPSVPDTCAAKRPVAYHSLRKNAHAVTFDLPYWAAKNGIQLTTFLTPGVAPRQGSMPMSHPGPPGGTGQSVAGYPGIQQKVFHVGGTYSTLAGLQHFVDRMPIGIELTSIQIQKNTFQAGITAYGLAS